ncbi:hypothetical protein HYC85_015064 [Camellia sinensis]|uniref:Uncharacterized protein n=1 Tax=Camellia sinensis TaxID=4442 RepID=A0A7J7H993_CAMSI|nr:hypothetical protein HYC85_015064 [Camellia sinensis]
MIRHLCEYTQWGRALCNTTICILSTNKQHHALSGLVTSQRSSGNSRECPHNGSHFGMH